MRQYRVDLHMHSVLSPCGDMTMSPSRIIAIAGERGIDILGISDHNSTLQCKVMLELGKEEGIKVLPGVEVNTKEEIHCLAFFSDMEATADFQAYLERKLPAIPNQSIYPGQQLLVDRYDKITGEVDIFLGLALNASIYEISEEVYKREGIFIPSHIDRPYSSILSQLGQIPGDLRFDALEVSARYRVSEFLYLHPELKRYTLITNSDAHVPHAIGRATTTFRMENDTFDEIRLALNRKDRRTTLCP
jgi:PHP family Zn ribbon phosphoesterase